MIGALMIVSLLSCTKDSGIIDIKNNSRPEDKCGIVMSSDNAGNGYITLKVEFKYGIESLVIAQPSVDYKTGDTYCK